jgi:hypothetical protein
MNEVAMTRRFACLAPFALLVLAPAAHTVEAQNDLKYQLPPKKIIQPLVQIGLAVTQKEGFPLFHKVFDGNVHDARTLSDLVTLFGSYRLEAGLFIYDRGIQRRSGCARKMQRDGTAPLRFSRDSCTSPLYWNGTALLHRTCRA